MFEKASVDELLDIRSELTNPLARFRRAMIVFSETMRNAAWDEAFAKEAELVFYREVEPAVIEIEESVRTNPYLIELTRHIISKPLLPSEASILTLAISKLASFSDFASLALGGAAFVATAAYDVKKKWQEKYLTAQQNQMFFYYTVGKRIGK
jgi:hypothetical protein